MFIMIHMYSTNQELSFDMSHAHMTEIMAFLPNIAPKFTKLPCCQSVLAAILDIIVRDISYDKICFWNGFAMIEIVRIVFWNIQITPKIRNLKKDISEWRPSWIAYYHLLHLVQDVCWIQIQMFKVSTARKMQLKAGRRAVCVPRDSAYIKKNWTVIQSILAAILDFGILGMCYDNMIVRNEFAMLKFVENDILIILIAQK